MHEETVPALRRGMPQLLLAILLWASVWGIFELFVLAVARDCTRSRLLFYSVVLAAVTGAYTLWPHLAPAA